ncbi:hypothetical protein D0Z07_7153 [Hyphodiscus hymeniophilus]|uniref:Uncharacterized protein n=1 Tax=Hyphodiscus hymeniophilus TaxID=353542 RepID=A0A9P6VG63_9HELO|nr:hypothetical protein D0Z07_7153 [Hyphodiscus hymeniophilus]
MYFFTAFTLAFLFSLTQTHGIVTHPPVREPGPASLFACGPAITELIKSNNQTGTKVLHKVSSTDAKFQAQKCNIALCKSLQLEDNLSNVQIYKTGQVVLQWTWFGRVVKQTYESCIDFTISDETSASDLLAIEGDQKILN